MFPRVRQICLGMRSGYRNAYTYTGMDLSTGMCIMNTVLIECCTVLIDVWSGRHVSNLTLSYSQNACSLSMWFCTV